MSWSDRFLVRPSKAGSQEYDAVLLAVGSTVARDMQNVT